MNSTQDHFESARNAVYQLRALARSGDTEAVIALRDLALKSADILSDLAGVPTGHPSIPESMRPGVSAAHHVVAGSQRWPAALSAVEEIRKGEVEAWNRLGVGSAIGIRLEGSRRRMEWQHATGFALDIFHELDAIRQAPGPHHHPADVFPELDGEEMMTKEQARRSWSNLAAKLPPLTKDSLTEWTTAGLALCREWCTDPHGVVDWNSFPWPEFITEKAASTKDKDNGHLCGIESAIREKIRQGFEKLLP